MASARLQHLTDTLSNGHGRAPPSGGSDSPVRPAPTVSSFRNPHVNAALLPGEYSEN